MTMAGIRVSWQGRDEDMWQLEIGIGDGRSSFVTMIYLGHSQLAETVGLLEKFHIGAGSLLDLDWGKFGPEYAAGALHLRLQAQQLGKIGVTAKAETEYFDFGSKHVAAGATLYFVTEPAQLDEFVRGLKAMRDNTTNLAELAGRIPDQMR